MSHIVFRTLTEVITILLAPTYISYFLRRKSPQVAHILILVRKVLYGFLAALLIIHRLGML